MRDRIAIETRLARAREKMRGTAGFAEYGGVALDSLRANKLRSFLTLLGIIIGITSIIVVICMLEGLNKYWKEKVNTFGPNTFVINQFGIITNPDDFFQAVRRNPEIHLDDAEAIARFCSACEQVGVETQRSVTVRYASQTLEQVGLSGVTPNSFDIDPLDLDSGRVLFEWENQHSEFVALVGWDIADKMFGNSDPLGKRVQVDGHWFDIIGVAAKRGTVFGFSRDNFVRVPLSTYQKIYGSRRSSNITIKAFPGQLQDAQDQARISLRTRHHLKFNDKDDFGVITSDGVNELFDTLTRTIFTVILFVVSISLVVGGIVIMNIMLVSVVERTKEIGIRKAVGARQADIVNQFLVEAVVLCCAGGGIGVLIAYGISLLLSMIFPSSFPLWAPL
ncbi:MAG TPA: ABC transporter permease, partial [Blastocatellia bacterium]|nr:ABC transporter permease [Blastocatellia bacterium]